jgi:hypothetical protein
VQLIEGLVLSEVLHLLGGVARIPVGKGDVCTYLIALAGGEEGFFFTAAPLPPHSACV